MRFGCAPSVLVLLCALLVWGYLFMRDVLFWLMCLLARLQFVLVDCLVFTVLFCVFEGICAGYLLAWVV